MFFQYEGLESSHFGVTDLSLNRESQKPKRWTGFETAVELKGPVFNSSSPKMPCVTVGSAWAPSDRHRDQPPQPAASLSSGK